MAMFKAYFDTSGTERDDKVVVTVGVIATVDKWAAFDRRWNAALADFGVTHFHMKDYAHFKGEFATWRSDETRRASFLERLIRVAKAGINKTFIHTVLLPDYRVVDSQFQMTELIGGAYALTQLACIQRCERWVNAMKGHHHEVQCFVAHGDVGQPAFIKLLESHGSPLPVFLPQRAADGTAWTPLQAADLIAYEHRRLHEPLAVSGFLPHEDDRRQSLEQMRRMLPHEAGVTDKETMVVTCVAAGIPARY